MSRTAGLFIVAIVVLAMAASVRADAADEANVGTNPIACPPGTIFELSGAGFPALSIGSVTIDGIHLGAISSGDTGAIRGFFMVPEMRDGPAKVRIAIAKTRASASFTVLPAGSPSSCPIATP